MMWRWGMGLVLLFAMLTASAASTHFSAELLKNGHGTVEQPSGDVHKLCKATGESSDEDVSYFHDANIADGSGCDYQPLTTSAQKNAFDLLHVADYLAAFQNRGPPGFSL